MGTELRRVPKNWNHPRDEEGNYIGMHSKYYGDAVDEWYIQHLQWRNGTHKDQVNPTRIQENRQLNISFMLNGMEIVLQLSTIICINGRPKRQLIIRFMRLFPKEHLLAQFFLYESLKIG